MSPRWSKRCIPIPGGCAPASPTGSLLQCSKTMPPKGTAGRPARYPEKSAKSLIRNESRELPFCRAVQPEPCWARVCGVWSPAFNKVVHRNRGMGFISFKIKGLRNSRSSRPRSRERVRAQDRVQGFSREPRDLLHVRGGAMAFQSERSLRFQPAPLLASWSASSSPLPARLRQGLCQAINFFPGPCLCTKTVIPGFLPTPAPACFCGVERRVQVLDS